MAIPHIICIVSHGLFREGHVLDVSLERDKCESRLEKIPQWWQQSLGLLAQVQNSIVPGEALQ